MKSVLFPCDTQERLNGIELSSTTKNHSFVTHTKGNFIASIQSFMENKKTENGKA